MVGCVEAPGAEAPVDGATTGDVDTGDDESSGGEAETGEESSGGVEEPSNVVWRQALARNEDEVVEPLAVAVGPDGAVFVAASLEDGDGEPRILSMRAFEADGTPRWQEHVESATAIEAAALDVEGERVGVAVGLSWNVLDDIDGKQQAWVLSTDEGRGVWGATVGAQFDVDRVGIDLEGDDVALAGSTRFEFSDGGATSGFLVAIFRDDVNTPAAVWMNGDPEFSHSVAHDVAFLPDGGVVATGVLGGDPYAVRLDAAGEPLWKGVVDFDDNDSVTVSLHDDMIYVHSNGEVVVTDIDGNLQRTFNLAQLEIAAGRLRWEGDEILVAGELAEGVGVGAYGTGGTRSWHIIDPAVDTEELFGLPRVDAAWLEGGDVAFLSSWPEPTVARLTQL